MNKIIRLSLLAFVVCALLGGTARYKVKAQAGTCPEAADLQTSQEPNIVAQVNKDRTAANLTPVTINALLTAAAQRQSNDMAAKDFLDHTGSDGSAFDTRAADAGYKMATGGENILFRMDLSADGAYQQWWNSPPHKANMMNPDYKEIGVAFACTAQGGKYYYTMVLGTSLDAGNMGQQPATPQATPDGIGN